MRTAPLVVIAIALAGKPAAADKFAPAADLSLAMSSASADLSTEGQPYLRFGGGIQRGRVALLLHVDATALTSRDATLDSSQLNVYGKGLGLRVELTKRKDVYLHLTTGVSFFHLSGHEDVRRGCSVFGGCDAGFYREVPDYHDVSPWLALGFGLRGHNRIWPGVGGELGIAPLQIDRSGAAPDSSGVVVWFGLNATLGGD